MTSGVGVNLHRGRSRRADPFPIVRGCLIALADERFQVGFQIPDRAFEQRRFAGAGRADKVERQDFVTQKPGSVFRGERLIGRPVRRKTMKGRCFLSSRRGAIRS
jgi:hypothetical protein